MFLSNRRHNNTALLQFWKLTTATAMETPVSFLSSSKVLNIRHAPLLVVRMAWNGVPRPPASTRTESLDSAHTRV